MPSLHPNSSKPLNPWLLCLVCDDVLSERGISLTHVQSLRADVLGSVAFTPVKSDMHGNIKVFPPTVYLPTTIAVLIGAPENPRPSTRCSRRVRKSTISRHQRTKNEKAHCCGRAAMAGPVRLSPFRPSLARELTRSQRSGFHCTRITREHQEPDRGALDIVQDGVRLDAQTLP